MSTLNLKKVGGLVKVEVNGDIKGIYSKSSTAVKFDPQPDNSFDYIIGNTQGKVAAITDVQIDGIAVTDLADFETKIATVFLNEGGGSGATPTLQQVVDEGGLANGSTLEEGTFDNGTGGNGGVSLFCSVGYELNFQGGQLRSIQQGDSTAFPVEIPIQSNLNYRGIRFTGLTNVSSVDYIVGGAFNQFDFTDDFVYQALQIPANDKTRVELYNDLGVLLAKGYYGGYVNGAGTQLSIYIDYLNASPNLNSITALEFYRIGDEDLVTSKEVNRRVAAQLIGVTATDYTALGVDAGNANAAQTAVGYQSGDSNTADYQSAYGYQSGAGNSGEAQTAIGYSAGNGNSGESQTAVGYNSGNSNTGDEQTAVGAGSGANNNAAKQTAIGTSAGQNNSGLSQTAVGYSAGFNNTGEAQTAIGDGAGHSNATDFQTAVGYEAGKENTGDYQTAIGYQAGYQNDKIYQTAVGYQAGYLNTGTNNTAIGFGAGTGNAYDNVNLIGYQAQATGDNQTVLGHESASIIIYHYPQQGSDSNYYLKVNVNDGSGNNDYWIRLYNALP